MDGMENKDTQGHSNTCAMCGYGMGGMRMGGGHWGHIIFKILVALFIFWCGVQFGEVKGMLRAGYGYGMMSPSGGWMQAQNGPPGMFVR
jgi:hypothetical protein